MKYLITSLFILASITIYSQGPSDPHKFNEVDFDVISYSPIINITNLSDKEISGKNIIELNWNEGKIGNEFYFHCEGLTIDRVEYNNEVVDFKYISKTDSTDAYYTIISTDKDVSASILIAYHGTMTSEGGNLDWGGVHYSQGKLYSIGVGFFNPTVSATRHWLPCYDHPSDKAKFDMTISVQDSLFAISNGVYNTSPSPISTFKFYNWSSGDSEIATYLMTFAIGDYAKVEIPSDDIPVTAYMYNTEESIKAGKYAFNLVPEMITAFEDFFRYDYPFGTMGYYAASKGAMEHQTMVTMSHSQILRTERNKDSMYSTAAHELAHQWFGNLVTPFDFRDAWLNEGFATFCEYVWIKSKLGEGEYRKDIMKLRKSYIANTAIPEQHIPLYNFSRFSKNNYPATIYKKGGLVLALIYDLVGDEIFRDKINEYLTKYGGKNATTEDLKNIFSDVLDDKFWETWVYGRGFPQIDIDISSDEENTYVVAKQRDNEFQIFDLELNYSISFGAETENYKHSITNKIDTLVIPKTELVTNLEVIDNLYLYEIMDTKIITSVDNNQLPEIGISSNIIDKQLSITYSSDKYNREYSLEIVTLTGQSLLFNSGYFSGEKNYDLSYFASGTYFVYISDGENKIIEKIMVR